MEALDFDYSSLPLLAPSAYSSEGHSNQPIIRLLTIHPAKSYHASVKCSLEVWHLASAPKYEALSYTWGPEYPLHPINIDDGNGNHIFRVRASLFLALKRLRRGDRARIFWIDAVCIDQSSIPERNKTVSFMRDIYASALGGVVVWLGEQGPDTHLVQPLIDRLINFGLERDKRGGSGLHAHLSRARLPKYTIPNLDDPSYCALYNLLLTPWSSRVWVVQEIVMAPEKLEITILRGEFAFKMEEIARAFNFIYKYRLESWLGFRYPARFATIWGERITRRDNPDLLDVVMRNRLTYATDPRDKIYGFAGLVKEHGILIDYHKSITVEKVFTDFAIQCINKDKNLAFLGAISSASEKRSVSLPSWVPDWTDWRPHTYVLVDQAEDSEGRGIKHFTAAGPYSATFGEAIDYGASGELQVEGHIIDIAQPTSLPLRRDMTIRQRLEFFRSSEVLASYTDENTKSGIYDGPIREKSIYPHTKESLVTALFATLTMDDLYYHHSPRRFDSLNRQRRLRKRYDHFYRAVRNLIDSPHSGKCDPYLMRIFEDHKVNLTVCVAYNRQFVATQEKGYLGLFSEHTCGGDAIVLLKGARVPFVLRKREGQAGSRGEQVWQVIGDGYLHGAMKGELWDETKCQKFTLV